MAGPRLTTIKRLFAESGNRCAFPRCTAPIDSASGADVGEVAHIRAQDPGGPRYDAQQQPEERHGYENLILLCQPHTVIDDDEIAYTRDALVELYGRAKVTLPQMPWHALRHTFGSELAGRGVPLPVIKELMGHASITTTLRYVTVADDQKREAIARAFGQQVGNTVEKRAEVVKR